MSITRASNVGLPVFQGYGLSECASVVSLNAPLINKSQTMGQVLPHNQVFIEHGEVMIRGNTFLGYVGDKSSWHQKFIATGDLGYLDKEGFLTITGRKKNIIISSFGRNINPEWLEAELHSSPLFQQAFVFGDDQAFCSAALFLGAKDINVIGERDDSGDFSFQAYEIETRWMITEQGEYWADWGMLAELEKQHDADNWEMTTGVLFETEFGRTSLTMNMFIIYEWGETIPDEFEAEFRLQYRYRWLPEIQPAIEIYTGEDYAGIGPAFMGIHRFAGQKQLKWEAAFIAGIKESGKDHTLRIAIEYEF